MSHRQGIHINSMLLIQDHFPKKHNNKNITTTGRLRQNYKDNE